MCRDTKKGNVVWECEQEDGRPTLKSWIDWYFEVIDVYRRRYLRRFRMAKPGPQQE